MSMSTQDRSPEPAERYTVLDEREEKAAHTKTPMTFGDTVTPYHWRFDPAAHDEIYIVGDIHGSIDELKRLWAQLTPSGDDLVVFVGDLVRKGPASIEVVEFIAESPHAVSVKGNNEMKLVRETVETAPFEPVLETVTALPLVVSFGDSMVVHGGIHPEWELVEHEPDDLLEMRSVPRGNSYDGPFWFEQYTDSPRVFFGHTVLSEPYVSDSAVGLDTGCVYGGELTAYDWRRDELVSVSASGYQSRPDRKILSI